jgi:[ribosomal protein S18]-alanine N-acetyltransferase
VTVDEWSEEHARTASAWHYEPPFDFYDLDSDPDDAAELFDPGFRPRYRAVLGADGSLEGFWYFRPDGDEVEVGLGLRPDLTGRGLGRAFAEAALDYARREWAPRRFRLFVAAWNARAIRVYERLGFEEVERETRVFALVGEHEFVRMEAPA